MIPSLRDELDSFIREIDSELGNYKSVEAHRGKGTLQTHPRYFKEIVGGLGRRYPGGSEKAGYSGKKG